MKVSDIYDRRLLPFGQRSLDRIREISKVYEGLVVSQPPWSVSDKIKKHFPDVLVKFSRDPDSNLLTIRLTFGKQILSIDQFNKLYVLINNLGWYGSWYITPIEEQVFKFNIEEIKKLLQTDRAVIVQIEAKYDVEEMSKPRELYHGTPLINVDKILRQGIVPKSKAIDLSYPDRIYLATKLDNLVDKLIPHIAEEKKITDWAIFKIKDLNNISPRLRLFRDPLYPYGYYALANIPPKNIELIKKFSVSI